MRPSTRLLIPAMLFSNDVWATYGIVARAEDPCTDCLANSTSATAVQLPFETPVQGSQHSTNTLPATETPPSTTAEPSSLSTALSETSAPFAPTATSTQDLSTGAKAGIGITVAILCLALACVLLESCYLKRKRRERALQQAVNEVEMGMHKGSEERIVLESRVSIVFDEEDDSEEEEERGRTRNGMSLPRRM